MQVLNSKDRKKWVSNEACFHASFECQRAGKLIKLGDMTNPLFEQLLDTQVSTFRRLSDFLSLVCLVLADSASSQHSNVNFSLFERIGVEGGRRPC